MLDERNVGHDGGYHWSVADGHAVADDEDVWFCGGVRVRRPSNAMTSREECASAETGSRKLLHREVTDGGRRATQPISALEHILGRKRGSFTDFRQHWPGLADFVAGDVCGTRSDNVRILRCRCCGSLRIGRCSGDARADDGITPAVVYALAAFNSWGLS